MTRILREEVLASLPTPFLQSFDRLLCPVGHAVCRAIARASHLSLDGNAWARGQLNGTLAEGVTVKTIVGLALLDFASTLVTPCSHSHASVLSYQPESQPMTPYKKHNCPVTKRLAEDMLIRNMAPRTIDAYTYHARRFTGFIGKPLDEATVEDVRTFQLYLIQEKKVAYSSFNQAVCALRFLYTHTIQVPWPVTMVPFGKRPTTLPIVLSRHEIDKLLQCTANLKHRTFLMTLYSAGLRFSEATHLRIADLDSDRMMIHVRHDKGAKERLVPLSPRLLTELRVYWKKFRPTDLLFPGNSATKTYADTSIQKAMKRSAEKAGIKKRVYPHVLRHSYLQTQVESAKEREQDHPPAMQLSLPGLAASRARQESYLVDSF